MLRFHVEKCLGKCVGDHVISRTINKINGPIINNGLNEMILDINVFGVSVIRPIMGECNGSL